ncbi:DNA-binding transcriptional regulator, AcrR family [Paractinoplanes atraurantiacus]|uniref:DNA-binding transcriptional regulator, AcrR family n=1 Tax=Paractinoplanes atraurantiacus TaxID=1036182 RepID=A0A285II25_9ACTN|nr:DNA-binding transcriptional regulator, AcrR family [Actinoplanes atraurantiacus]
MAAARQVFAEQGFDKATIREIARRADVTHGLVMRHFESKERLFLAAVPGTRDLAASVAGDLDGLPGRIADSFVRRMESADSADPFVALVRAAAADQEAAKALLAAMRSESVAAYRAVLPGPQVDERVDLLGAFLMGVTVSRYVLGDGPLAAMPPERLAGYLAGVLRTILLA